MRGVFGCMGCGMFLLLVVILGLFGWLSLSYRTWRIENSQQLSSFTEEEWQDTSNMRDFNQSVDEYKDSPAQRETMFIDCDVFESVLEDSLNNSWESDNVEEVGLVCSERSLKLYIKTKGVWLIVDIWQKTSGEADFAVYDFSVGPHSLHDFTGGLVSEKISKGINDAFELFSGENFPGRKVDEIYISDEGLRIIGVK